MVNGTTNRYGWRHRMPLGSIDLLPRRIFWHCQRRIVIYCMSFEQVTLMTGSWWKVSWWKRWRSFSSMWRRYTSSLPMKDPSAPDACAKSSLRTIFPGSANHLIPTSPKHWRNPRINTRNYCPRSRDWHWFWIYHLYYRHVFGCLNRCFPRRCWLVFVWTGAGVKEAERFRTVEYGDGEGEGEVYGWDWKVVTVRERWWMIDWLVVDGRCVCVMVFGIIRCGLGQYHILWVDMIVSKKWFMLF